MSLLDRKYSLSKIFRPGLILMIPVFLSCETADDIGISYNIGSNANVRFAEFDLPSTSIYIDSLRTDRNNVILTGQYDDDQAGFIRAEGYFQIAYENAPDNGPLPREELDEDTPAPVDTLQLDSVILTIDIASLLPLQGDALFSANLYELRDSLISSAIYLRSLEAEKADLVGSVSKLINTASDSVIQIVLDDEFSNALFDFMGDISEDSTRFAGLETFNSLGLAPNLSTQSMALFNLASDTSRLLVYSSPVSPERDTTYVTRFVLNAKHYSYLDRSQSTYGNLDDRTEFSTSTNETFVDPMFGLSTVFSIEELGSFFDEFIANDETIIINSASIEFLVNEEEPRDSLPNFYTFYYGNNDFFSPGIVDNPFAHVIMSDNGFLRQQNFPAISSFNSLLEEPTLVVNATLFFQTMYRNYVEFQDLVIEDPLTEDTVSVDQFVLLSQTDLTLQRTIFNAEGIKLNIFYTEVD